MFRNFNVNSRKVFDKHNRVQASNIILSQPVLLQLSSIQGVETIMVNFYDNNKQKAIPSHYFFIIQANKYNMISIHNDSWPFR